MGYMGWWTHRPAGDTNLCDADALHIGKIMMYANPKREFVIFTLLSFVKHTMLYEVKL